MEQATSVKTEQAFQLADRVNRISVSPTMAVLQEAERYKAKGVDVADFGPGEPDFPTPEHIKRGAIKALEENRTKYTATPGIAPLRQAICDWHAAQFGSSYQPAECIVTVGGKHAIFNVVCSLINAGDEVVIPRALLGELSGHRKIRRRQARLHPHARGRWFRSACRGPGKGHHAANPHRDRQFAQQPDRRGDSSR